jgi:hypothetical protein
MPAVEHDTKRLPPRSLTATSTGFEKEATSS